MSHDINIVAVSVESTIPIVHPVQPDYPIDEQTMTGILRDKLNETIVVVNLLRTEVLKLKEKV